MSAKALVERNSRVLKGAQGNSFDLVEPEGTPGKSREL